MNCSTAPPGGLDDAARQVRLLAARRSGGCPRNRTEGDGHLPAHADIQAALASGQVDALATDKTILAGYTTDGSVVLPDDLTTLINGMLAEMKANGDLDALARIWITRAEAASHQRPARATRPRGLGPQGPGRRSPRRPPCRRLPEAAGTCPCTSPIALNDDEGF
jgi:hypothetical protein